MIKQVLKRFMAMLLSIIMVSLLLPVTAMAAELVSPIKDLGVSYTEGETISWTIEDGNIVGSVKATTGCDGASAASTTLTLTNNKSVPATLSFDYEVEIVGGTIKFGETDVKNNGTHSEQIDKGGVLRITLTSSATANQVTKITLKNILLYDPTSSATVTFVPAEEGGSYTVDGEKITESTEKTNTADHEYSLMATAVDGFRFVGWISNGNVISSSANAKMHFDEDQTITAQFVDKTLPTFDVNGTQFFDLNEAVQYATEKAATTIVLAGDGTLKAGNYEIPKGITLLIPFDAKYTLYTNEPGYVKTAEPPIKFKKLTVQKDTTITVNGNISVSGKCYTSSSNQVCKPTGAYGQIDMREGSSIVLNSGANLYAWGYITGSGNIAAKSGSMVYEFFQVMDWRGGTATSNFKDNDNKVFPFSQYYVQNIEAPLTFEKGANETVRITVTAGGISASAEVSFMGDKGMFQLEDGSTVTKKYDSATDRMIFDMNGNAKLNGIAIENLPVIGTFNSNVYVLPINNNMTMNVNSGTMTLNQDTALLPGTQVNVANGAELLVAKGSSLYVYDDAQWSKNYVWNSNNYGIQPVAYSPSGKGSRGIADATVDVNGTFTADGAVYTTETGANIISSEGTGKYVQVNAPGTADKTYQASQNGSGDPIYYEIPITSAKLHNEDGTYTETANASAGDVFDYIKEKGKWAIIPNEITVSFNANNGEGTMESQTISTKEGGMLTANAFTREGYNFTGWNTAADGSGDSYVDGATVNLTEDTTLYAQWEIQKFTVTWVNDNGTELEKDENVEYGTDPEYNGETPTKESTAQYTYTFSRWDPEISKVTADITYKAVYDQTVNTYSVTWKNWDGTELQTDTFEYGAIPEYTGKKPVKESTEQYTYTFSRWDPEITAVTGNAEYTATFTDTIRTYTVTWKNWDGTVLEKDENVAYGSTPVYNGETPTKPADAQYTYTFKGWLPAVSAVTGDVTYTAVFSETLNKYTITWKNGDEVLKTEQVDYGDMPVYSGETPVKDGNAQYSYIFTGWTPEITAVTGDAEYAAVFEQKVNTYTVTWKNGENILKQDKLEYGETPAY